MAERNEKKIDRWSGYVAKVQGVRVVTPKDVDEKIDAALASDKFRESLMQILKSVEITALSQEIDKTRKEINGLKRRLAKLEKAKAKK